MTRPARLVVLLGVLLGVGQLAALAGAPQIKRPLNRTFTAAAGSTVSVRISGGPITVETGSGRSVQLTLEQNFENVSNDADADRALAEYDVTAAQEGNIVRVEVRRQREGGWRYRRGDPRVNFAARLTVPADVQLDVHTSGGPITVRGDRTAHVKADTSGGAITVDGGRANFDLDTSGGPIRVGRVLGNVVADTSGGSITVDYVGPTATEVSLDTSGGTIRVGVDRAAKLDIDASTSGGSVSIENLPFETRTLRRTRASGTMNGGGGRLTADTSGGSIEIRGM